MGVTADTQGGTKDEEGLEDRTRIGSGYMGGSGTGNAWEHAENAAERTKAAREQRERAGNAWGWTS